MTDPEINHFRTLSPHMDAFNITDSIGVRAGGARGAAAPLKFGQLRFFGQQEFFWPKPVFKEVSMLFFRRDRYFLF